MQLIGVTKRTGTVVPKAGAHIKTPEFKDEVAGLKDYHRDFELEFPLLVGEADANNVNFGEMGVPMTVIIDKDGVVRQINQGFKPGKDLPVIERLLKAKAAAGQGGK